MTTKFLDNKICTFKILLSWRFPRKQAFLDDFPLCPQGPPPLKSENFIFIVVSPSLKELYDISGLSSLDLRFWGAPILSPEAARPIFGRGTEQLKTGQVNLDHLSEHFRGHFCGRLEASFSEFGRMAQEPNRNRRNLFSRNRSPKNLLRR